VTVTPTVFIYKGGREDGAIVGLIQYPRFPASEDDIVKKATDLAETLKARFKQLRVSVMTPQHVFMIGDPDA
jgi:hypothetical protein